MSNTLYSSRVFHSGPYEGREIDSVVEEDPVYILEVCDDPQYGISTDVISRARYLLDNADDVDDFSYIEYENMSMRFNDD